MRCARSFAPDHDALTRQRPLRGEDAVRATVRKMSNQEADDVPAAWCGCLPPGAERDGAGNARGAGRRAHKRLRGARVKPRTVCRR